MTKRKVRSGLRRSVCGNASSGSVSGLIRAFNWFCAGLWVLNNANFPRALGRCSHVGFLLQGPANAADLRGTFACDFSLPTTIIHLQHNEQCLLCGHRSRGSAAPCFATKNFGSSIQSPLGLACRSAGSPHRHADRGLASGTRVNGMDQPVLTFPCWDVSSQPTQPGHSLRACAATTRKTRTAAAIVRFSEPLD